jgi:hypothetical protein
MPASQLEVVGLDCYTGHEFIVYFSDTYTKISSYELAACFPDRKPIPPEETE